MSSDSQQKDGKNTVGIGFGRNSKESHPLMDNRVRVLNFKSDNGKNFNFLLS